MCLDLHLFSLCFTQESGEFAEGLHAWTLPLWVTALPTRRPAEGTDSNSSLCPFCPICSVRPPLSPLTLLLVRCLLTCPHNHPQPASRHGTVSYTNIPAQPQHSCARLPPPDTSTYLPKPQPNTAAAMAVATSSTVHVLNQTKKKGVKMELQPVWKLPLCCMLADISNILDSTGAEHWNFSWSVTDLLLLLHSLQEEFFGESLASL